MPRLARLDAPGVLHHIMIRGIERWKIPELAPLRGLYGAAGNAASGDEDLLLCVGLDAQSRSLSFLHGDGARCAPDETTADRICGQFQSAAQTPRASFSKSVQIDYLQRLRISAPGVGYAVEGGEAIVQESHYELIQ